MRSLCLGIVLGSFCGLLHSRECVAAAATRRCAEPRIVSTLARRYRSELRREAHRGPNFNRHYRILSWGCGTACMYWSVIDLRSGFVWISPMITNAVPRMDEAGEPHWVDATLEGSTVRVYSIVDDDAMCPRDAYLERTFVWTRAAPTLTSTACIAYADQRAPR